MEEPYYQREFSTCEFARRRAQVAAAIGDGIAVFQGAPATGAFNLFRQFNDFFYLTGVEVPHAYLTVDGRTGRSSLYLLPGNPKLAEQEGVELSASIPEDVARLTGCDSVKDVNSLIDDLRDSSCLYVCRLPQEGRQACQDTLNVQAKLAVGDPIRGKQRSLADELAQFFPRATIRDASPLLQSLRRIKSPAELAVMRRAGQVTALAIAEAMRSTVPGILEGQLAAVADYVFQVNGATGGGYRSIVASGKNIWNMHYFRNNCRLSIGELVLMDYAPEVSCYTSDIGRMWPVSGRYEPWQRELYGFVVDYHLQLLDLIEPGKTAEEICRSAAHRLLPTVRNTHWSRPAFAEAVNVLLQTGRPFTHGVGMAIHEEPRYQEGVLRPGVVFALDPQLWVPGEQLYIRVEDTVAVTDDGVENFTQGCPCRPDDVERLMTEPGMIRTRSDLILSEPSAI